MSEAPSTAPPSAPTPTMTGVQRAAAIRQLQRDALTVLPLDTLYIALYIRADPPQPNNFHWAYYLHTDFHGGVKYHVKSLGSGWIADHAKRSGVFKSNFLCVLIRIATVRFRNEGELDQIMRSHDSELNSMENITCRVWLMNILEKLMQNGIVHCGNLTDLQQECWDFGNQYRNSAAVNEQPRPVVRSKLCL